MKKHPKFTVDDIVPLDPLRAIRKRPDMYLGTDVVSPSAIALRLQDDAKLLGARETTVREFQDWTIVSGDIDWLSLGAGAPSDSQVLFENVFPFPEAGVNSFRGEILVAAFASLAITSTPTERLAIAGRVDSTNAIWEEMLNEGMSRAIAFQLINNNKNSE